MSVLRWASQKSYHAWAMTGEGGVTAHPVVMHKQNHIRDTQKLTNISSCAVRTKKFAILTLFNGVLHFFFFFFLQNLRLV